MFNKRLLILILLDKKIVGKIDPVFVVCLLQFFHSHRDSREGEISYMHNTTEGIKYEYVARFTNIYQTKHKYIPTFDNTKSLLDNLWAEKDKYFCMFFCL